MSHPDAPISPSSTEAKPTSSWLIRLVRLGVILTVIIVIAALKAAATIILPLVFALFLVALFFPLQRRLQQHMRPLFATALTLLALVGTLAGLVAILWVSALAVIESLPQYGQDLQRVARLAESYGINIGVIGANGDEGAGMGGDLLNFATIARVALGVAGAGGLLALISSYLVLTLLGFDDYARRVDQILPLNEGQRWLDIARQAVQDFQRYIGARTIMGFFYGISTSLVVGLFGLHFALVWGLLAYLLSYIPIFGSIISFLLPVLFAAIQFDSLTIIVLIPVVLLIIRALLSGVVDPMVQAKLLKPTPLTVLLSVTFWGWLWGVPGAFIGVPLTTLLVIICRQFQPTRWIAILLADTDEA